MSNENIIQQLTSILNEDATISASSEQGGATLVCGGKSLHLDEEAIKALINHYSNASGDENNEVSVKTPIGTLFAVESGFTAEGYPGIWVCIRKPGAEAKPDNGLALALVEYTETEGDLPSGGHLITRVYGDGLVDEYTDRIIHTNTEKSPYFSLDDMGITPSENKATLVDNPE